MATIDNQDGKNTVQERARVLLDVLKRLQDATRAYRYSDTVDALDASDAVDEVAIELGELLCPLDGTPDFDLANLSALAAAQAREVELHRLAHEATRTDAPGVEMRAAHAQLVGLCLSLGGESGQLAQDCVHDGPETKTEHQTQHETLPVSKRTGLQPEAEGNDRDDRAEQAEPELKVHTPHATELQHRFGARLTDELTREGAQ